MRVSRRAHHTPTLSSVTDKIRIRVRVRVRVRIRIRVGYTASAASGSITECKVGLR